MYDYCFNIFRVALVKKPESDRGTEQSVLHHWRAPWRRGTQRVYIGDQDRRCWWKHHENSSAALNTLNTLLLEAHVRKITVHGKELNESDTRKGNKWNKGTKLAFSSSTLFLFAVYFPLFYYPATCFHGNKKRLTCVFSLGQSCIPLCVILTLLVSEYSTAFIRNEFLFLTEKKNPISSCSWAF